MRPVWPNLDFLAQNTLAVKGHCFKNLFHFYAWLIHIKSTSTVIGEF